MMLRRTIFTSEHDQFRDTVRRFIGDEITPYYDTWDRAGQVDRGMWEKAGAAGLLCTTIPEEYGGGGVDRLFAAIVIEEISRSGNLGILFSLHSDIVAPYILNYGTEAQKRRYLPAMAAGRSIGAVAMTEPGAGSDLQSIAAHAVREGDHYIVNGAKTFISNGQTADIFVVAVKTDPAARAKGTSLLIVDGDTPGLVRGRRLEKIGLHAQDTSELFFDDMRVPVANLLGSEGRGFSMLMTELAWERVQIGISAVALCEAALEWTIDYTKQRKAFGGTLFELQNTRFRLAELATETQMARVFVDRCLEEVNGGMLDAATAAMIKYQTSDLARRLLDECVQLHGGYGFMREYPIARAFVDYRYQPIAGGANEVMKDLIARAL